MKPVQLIVFGIVGTVLIIAAFLAGKATYGVPAVSHAVVSEEANTLAGPSTRSGDDISLPHRAFDEERAIYTSADSLTLDFDENEVAANDKYREASIILRGWVDGVDDEKPDLHEPATINLKPVSAGKVVKAALPRDLAVTIKAGQAVELRCEGATKRIYVLVSGCTTVKVINAGEEPNE
ncbi:MAG: hypothetical protein ABI673_02525 [Novosphingobium sp.]